MDVYLHPLIVELKELWETCAKTCDFSKKRNFQMRATFMWTISDFLDYATLYGWSIKGEFACLVCNKHTHSKWLKHFDKHFYMLGLLIEQLKVLKRLVLVIGSEILNQFSGFDIEGT